MNKNKKNNSIKSLNKTLKILKLFTKEKSEWSVQEIINNLGYHRSSVQRILTTLIKEDFIRKDEGNKNLYRLGIEIFILGKVAANELNIKKIAVQYLENLVVKTNETAHLGIVNQNQCLYIEKRESPYSIRMFSEIGKRLPLHCSAIGKALLSGMEIDEIEKIISQQGLKKFTNNTIYDKALLLKEIRSIKAKGFSIDNEEIEYGLRCIGAPILDSQGNTVAALSIAGPTQRINKKVYNEFIKHVKEAAEGISLKLGYRKQ